MRFKLNAVFALLIVVFVTAAAQAQQPDCAPLRPLLPIPEIKSDPSSHILKATVFLSDEQRSLAGISSAGTPTCNFQQLRMFQGYTTGNPQPWPKTGDVLPGPTLRARVGDLIELTFMNLVNPKNFPNTLDQGEEGKTPGCDVATFIRNDGKTKVQGYPRDSTASGPPWTTPPWGGIPGDSYPNCLHGSSTANLHYHGTHTTPSTTGDNVLLFIRPRILKDGKLQPDESFVNAQFALYFKQCEQNGPAQQWKDLPGKDIPVEWQKKQEELLKYYDATAPYKGVNGALPDAMKLWPRNEEKLTHKPQLWPQYSVGAFPYCFKVPQWKEVVKPDNKPALMGQAPGTHWYHAHKHGSTALNVGNGMTGALIIEGTYDDTLKNFYKATADHKNWGLEEQVLVIQQLETALNLLSPTNRSFPPGTEPVLSVNGRVNPIVTMKPNQVQMWRIVNGAARDFVEFSQFLPHGPKNLSIAWRQIAQDGVQFKFENYERVGKINAKFNMAPANRVDLLVKAPDQEADYPLLVVVGVSDVPSGTPIQTLLTVRVKKDDKPIDPPMDFIKDPRDFPVQPPFLADIYGPMFQRKPLVFNTEPSSGRSGKGYLPRHTINGKLFEDKVINQCMNLDATEEWTLENKTTNIAHPFHIHINPFQIVELFQPNTADRQDPRSQCYADPTKPATWQSCAKLPAPWVWWDAFSVPTARNDTLICSSSNACPSAQGTACTPNTQVCTVSYPVVGKPPLTRTLACTAQNTCPVPAGATLSKDCSAQTACTVNIPGYFKMRSRFVDFTGQYVLHCHILAHEDRGMMELVAVEGKCSNPYNVPSEYSHH